MKITFTFEEKDDDREVVYNIPGCYTIGDVFQVRNCLYKIATLTRERNEGYGTLSFCRDLDEKPSRQKKD